MDTTDKIGDRLDHPERVPPEQRHLVADDQARVAKILEWPVSGRVLDVGCSDGAVTRRIASSYPDAVVTGADARVETFDGFTFLSTTAVDGVRGGWWRWDAREAPPQEYAAYFDAVYCCEVFEHLSQHDATSALRNICAVLKPGGDLIVTVPNRHCRQTYTEQQRDRWRWPDHWSTWTLDSLYDFLAPHFASLDWKTLYDGDIHYAFPEYRIVNESIWLMVRAVNRL